MPSAHLCSPVTRAHRSVLAPLDARALLHHYPMPLKPAFSPLARPAPPPCLPSLYCARCLLLRCTACNSKQSLRPEGVRISPGCWRGAAARSGSRPTGCWVLPDPHPCASSPSSLNPSPPSHPPRRPRRRRLLLPSSSPPPSPPPPPPLLPPPQSSPQFPQSPTHFTQHHSPPTHSGWAPPAPQGRVEGREGEGERGERDQGGEGSTALCGALMRCAGRIPGRAEPNAAVRAPWPTWARGTCRPLPPRAPVGCLRVSKIISNMCSILMSGYQTKAYHLISRTEAFWSPGRVSALLGAATCIRKPPRTRRPRGAPARGLRSRSHWGVG